ncbi:SEC-C metal-binding domain-containing protein [Photobacterium sp. DA100]|uniref:YecA family protein n=1 Tax=Photobacterium sp. DA100 TaxID=3027472 RepID=UPI00247B0932|nr:SEC-C metal-binding domain-containing protein [Photobacterium sp. DA100]WEM41498.1 SEC-C metal-binding domain-containing protein [Photobacterium sp. DA100]
MTQLMTLPEAWDGMPATFIEGALLAANANPKPLAPEIWLPVLITGGVDEDEPVALEQDDKVSVLNHFELQYRHIKAGEYTLPEAVSFEHAGELTLAMQQFAEGFLAVWPYIEPNWAEQPLTDGTMRMLSALITTLMLMLDEDNTLAQMQEAGVTGMPAPAELYAQLPLMLTEVVMAADELQQGNAAQAVNPYKETGRNDLCPCGSGKKFKQCCGK